MSARVLALAGAFLTAAVAANLVIAEEGPSAAPIVGFALVGVALVIRDRLDDELGRRELLAVMGAVVAIGTVLTYLVAPDAGRVALGSAVAFAAATIVDTVVYRWSWRDGRGFLERSTLSNVPAAAVDSVAFFAVAFGTLDGSFRQFCAKLAGATIAALLIVEARRRR